MADLQSLQFPSTLKKSKNLLNLSNDEKQKFLDSFDLILCDIDGVIWETAQKPLAGVDKGVEFLKSLNKKLVFVTNNSIRSTNDTIIKFQESGIKVHENEIIHPARSVVDYLKSIQFQGLIYAIGNAPFKMELEKAGYKLIDGPNYMVPETVKGFQSLIVNCTEPVRAVIIDVDFNLSIGKLIRAQMFLKNSDCILIAGAADPVIPFGPYEIIGPGAFIEIVGKFTNKTPLILGKPGIELSNLLKERFKYTNPSKVLFIGDSLEADISFGNGNNFQTLLVLSGKTKINELEKISNNNYIPDFYIESLANFSNFN